MTYSPEELRRLHEALEEIKELTERRQLPLTHEINGMASAALAPASKETDDA